MNRQYFFNRFEFQNDRILNNDIKPISRRQLNSVITHGQRDLS